MPSPDPISPARRAKLLQAHQLRCQGLTLRQIAEQMHCAHSTVGRYLKEFQQHRTQITESLADDQLLEVLQQLDQDDDSGHERRIHAARELRLLLDALDRITDRRQRRQRRVEENYIADQVRLIKELGELAQEFSKAGPPPLDRDQLDPSELQDLMKLHKLVGGTPARATTQDPLEPAEPDPPTVGQGAATADQDEPESSTIDQDAATFGQDTEQESEQSPIQSGKWPDDPREVPAYLASISPSSAPPPRNDITSDAYAALRELQRTYPHNKSRSGGTLPAPPPT